MLALNAREAQLLIDPQVDLAREGRTLAHAEWILPLTQPPNPTGVPLLLITRTPDALVMTNAAEQDFPLADVSLHVGDQHISRETWGAGILRERQCVILQSTQSPPPALVCEQIVRMPLDLPPLFSSEPLTAVLAHQTPLDCTRRCILPASF